MKFMLNLFHTWLNIGSSGETLLLKGATQDALAHLLFTYVAPSFMGKENEVESGVTHRVHNKAEALAKNEAMEIPNEEVEKRVFLSGEGQLTVHSFTNGMMLYLVHLEAAGREKNTCTCPMHCDSGSLCKHIFLAERFWKAKSSPQTISLRFLMMVIPPRWTPRACK
ncbi:hypothetical protein HF325_001475 [Metschnikowia pulcherrima]|uniref:SWIM-type domain-containing protein n=1 Tax=Metschnikowia pulcherrima TaxID=27326 RepID=A0A8H7GWM0_9ASCO|nr:hypothetical protein HF325_001475 [Metschnikowia pulcherrima]